MTDITTHSSISIEKPVYLQALDEKFLGIAKWAVESPIFQPQKAVVTVCAESSVAAESPVCQSLSRDKSMTLNPAFNVNLYRGLTEVAERLPILGLPGIVADAGVSLGNSLGRIVKRSIER